MLGANLDDLEEWIVTEVVYWIAFNRVSGVGPSRFRRLLAAFDQDLERAWRAPASALRAAGLDRRTVESIQAARRRLVLEEEMARVEAHGVTVLTWHDPDYPRLLRHIPASPPVLYLRGTRHRDDDWAIAIVGTRKVSDYGRRATERFAGALAGAGLTVVSGLALGVDRIAHEAAIAAGGRTIAVLANGVERAFPVRNRRMAESMVESGRALLISDYPIGTRPEPSHFPPRNRIISGLALATLVIEAGARSGALITAQNALEQGREVFALPGSVFSPTSRGTNNLISEGAIPALEPETILDTLDLNLAEPRTVLRQVAATTAAEEQLLTLLGTEPQHVDELGAAAELPAAELSGTLALLELKGLVRQSGTMRFVRR